MTDGPPVHLSGILFDVDGTLVDSTFFHTVCWWQAFRQQELDVPAAVIHRAIGMGADKLVEHVLSEIGRGAESDGAESDGAESDGAEPDPDELADAHDALYAAYWTRLRPLPGASKLLRRCHAAGLTTVLASSAAGGELAVLTKALDCDDAIDFATSSADAEASKPAPDIVAVALDKAQLTADRALFVGDAVWDMQAAGKLDLACIGLESGGTSAAELRAAGAFATYSDPQDLLLHTEEWLMT